MTEAIIIESVVVVVIACVLILAMLTGLAISIFYGTRAGED